MNKNLKTLSSLTFLKALSSLLGLIYSVLQVRFFGASSLMDAFFIATSAVYLITSLTQGGQLAEVFLPEYIRYKSEKGIEGASRLLSVVINRILVWLGGSLVLIYIIAPWIIGVMGSGLPIEYQEVGTSIFRASLILIIFNIVASFVNTTLNAEQIFGRAELTGLINSLLSICLLILFYKNWGIWVLIVALIIGKIVEFIIGLFFLRQVRFRYYFVWKIDSYDINKFFKVIFTTSIYVGATQFYNVVLTAMASYLPEGTFSIFNYVNQLTNKAKNIVLTPISTVFFSKFSIKSVFESRLKLSKYLKIPVVGLSIFCFLQLILVILLGEELLQLLWSEKALSEKEHYLAYLMLILNMIAVIFSSIGLIFRKSGIALGASKELYRGWTVVQLFSALYSFITIKLFSNYGLITIPLTNFFLISLNSFLVATNNGINTSAVFGGVSGKKAGKYLSSLILFIILIVLVPYFLPSNLTIVKKLLIKFLVFIGILVIILLFLRKELLLGLKNLKIQIK